MKHSLLISFIALSTGLVQAKGLVYVESIQNLSKAKGGSTLAGVGALQVAYKENGKPKTKLINPGETFKQEILALDLNKNQTDSKADGMFAIQPSIQTTTISGNEASPIFGLQIEANKLVLKTPQILNLKSPEFENKELKNKDWVANIIIKDNGVQMNVKPK